MPRRTSRRAPAPRTLIITHDECEHEGDIDRDLAGLRSAGLSFTNDFTACADGPEVGWTLITTTATDKEIEAAAAKGETCIRGWTEGDRAGLLSQRDQEEDEHRYEEEREGDLDDDWG